MRTKLALFAAACMLLAPLALAHAQWSSNPLSGSVIVTNAPGDDQGPRVIRLGSGSYLVTWWHSDVVDDPGKSRYQILDSLGTIQLGPAGNLILPGASWNYIVTSILPDGQGGAIAVFLDSRDGYSNIYGQRFDQNGVPIWGPTGLMLAETSDPQGLGISDFVSDHLGNFFISFIANVAPQWPWEINLYAQKFDVDGNRLWGDGGIPMSTSDGSQAYAKAVPDEAGGIIAIWEDDRTQINSYKLYTQHLNSQGNPVLTPNGEPVLYQGLQISAGGLYDSVPTPNGGVWTWLTSGQSNYFKLMRVTYADSSYRVEWLNTSTTYCYHAFMGMLAHPAEGAIWLSYYDERYGGGADADYLYRYDLNGNPAFGVNGIPYGGASLVPVSNGVITFKSYYYNTPGVDVTNMVARRLNNNGHLVWQTVAAQGIQRIIPSGYLGWAIGSYNAVSDGVDGAVVAFEDWQQQPITGVNISAQRILANGGLGNPPPPATPVADQSAGIHLNQGLLSYNLPQVGNIKAELYDILGRKISTLYEGYRETGPFTIPLPQEILPSGVYLIRLTTPKNMQTAKIVITR